MTASIIITFCVLLLIAYLFDLTSSKTRIPSVIFLLGLGYVVKQGVEFFGIQVPKLDEALSVFATLGLILIVLEGSLELELNKSKVGLIFKSFFGALIPILILGFAFAYGLQYLGGYPLNQALINAIPLCVISSAIAIPSVRNLSSKNREFVVYESSLSDIIGVIFFNFMVFNDEITAQSFTDFFLQMLLLLVISFVATILLSLLLSKIEHHIKFVPIILLIILLYEEMKIYHLPALIFILIFGLFLGNLDELGNIKFIKRFNPEGLNKEVMRFKDLIIEGAFLIRSMFFIIFGYQLEATEILNMETLAWAIAVVIGIYLIRFLQLVISRLDIFPLLFVAPRGLITILLFIGIAPEDSIPFVNQSLITQVIILTALIMMFGLLTNKKSDEPNELTVAMNDVNGGNVDETESNQEIRE